MANAFQLDELDGGIGLVTFNVPEKKVNTLGREVLQELGGLAAKLEKRTDLRGLLLRSTKQGQFVAGADLNELAAMSYASADQVAGLLTSGHQLFSRISHLPFPMVALIDGACMGGGTELALTMDERLVSTAPHTKISLPEVSLGLLPGWGGTQRLPRLIGINAGIEMVCSSEVIQSAESRRSRFRLRRRAARELARRRPPADRVSALPTASGRNGGKLASSRSGSMPTSSSSPSPSPRGPSRARPRGNIRRRSSRSRRFATAAICPSKKG